VTLNTFVFISLLLINLAKRLFNDTTNGTTLTHNPHDNDLIW